MWQVRNKHMKWSLLLVVSLGFSACMRGGDHLTLAPKSQDKTGGVGGNSGSAGNTSNSNCKEVASDLVTYDEDIKPIFQTYCKTCHSAGPLNWLDYKNFMSKEGRLQILATRLFIKGDMPMAGADKPTQNEMNLIKKWIELNGPESRRLATDPACKDSADTGSAVTTTTTTSTTLPSSVETPVDPAQPADPNNPTDPAQPADPAQPTDPANPPDPGTPIVPVVPSAYVGYIEDIKPIIENKCALCHSNGDLNWLDYKIFSNRGEKILDRVIVKKDMPPSYMQTPLSDLELKTFQLWLDQGAAETRDKAVFPTQPAPAPTPAPPAVDPGFTYTKDIVPLITKYCKDCHSAGTLNWFEYANIKRVADSGSLKERLIGPRAPDKVPMPMPYFPQPSVDELDVFRKWIEQGAAE
jgi:uncharacterized membrane protein